MQLEREAKLLTVIGLNTKHADCRIIFMLYPIQNWQNHNIGDKTLLKNILSLDFSLHVSVSMLETKITINRLIFIERDILMSF